MRHTLVSIMLILFLAHTASAACVGPDRTAVQAAVTAAARGATVEVCAGSATWSSPVYITKAMTIQGAGAGSTIITGNMSTEQHMIVYYYQWNQGNPADENVDLRITGLTLDAADKSGHIQIRHYNAGWLNKVRIDNNVFNGCRSQLVSGAWLDNTLMFLGDINAVVDNNTFSGRPSFRTYGDGGGGAYQWGSTSYNLGSQGVYVEDNIINNTDTSQERVIFMSSGGGNLTARYNTITMSNTQYNTLVDAHPNLSSSVFASRGVEVYGNKFVLASTCPWGWRGWVHRGGRARIFYNRTITACTTGTGEVMEETADTASATGNACPSGQGCLYAGNYCDTQGYPQHVNKSYIWSNRFGPSGGAQNLVTTRNVTESGYANGLVENIHYWQDNGGCSATGTCSSGVGCGSDTPSGYCSTGAAYWKTSQSCSDLADYVGKSPTTPISGTLYRCYPQNTWSVYYHPYTYPHPLRGGADTTDPVISNLCAGAGSCVTPIIEIPCADETEPYTVDVLVGASTNENATVKIDSSAGTDYTSGTWDATMTGGGGATHTTTLTGLACGASYTRYLKASDTAGNITDADTTLTFTIASKAGATPVLTNLTGQHQAIAAYQSVVVGSSVAATCRYCVKDVGGCTTATAWTSRAPFSQTGGDTVHHLTGISMNASSTAYIEVLCQDTQGVESSNLEIPITTDAQKTFTIGAGSQTLTIGTGSNTLTILP